jgi:hypothetical protein
MPATSIKGHAAARDHVLMLELFSVRTCDKMYSRDGSCYLQGVLGSCTWNQQGG